jgi:hypothetical protein
MKLLSIDVGIKNLSFCLFEVTNKEEIDIIKWENINLVDENEFKCCENSCQRSAKFTKNYLYYCKKHAKNGCIFHLTKSQLNKKTKEELINIAIECNIQVVSLTNKSKLVDSLYQYEKLNSYSPIIKKNATKVDLVTIGRNIQLNFNEILSDFLDTIDTVIIENQIGPIANKMKTIQGMISQYFIMSNENINIEFVSASNKLKDFIDNNRTDYKERKKLGTQICKDFMNNDSRFFEWTNFLDNHKKKDDLSDCFLQGMWFINSKLNI